MHLKPVPKSRMNEIEIGVTFRTLRSLGLTSGSWVMIVPERQTQKQHVGRIYLLNLPYVDLITLNYYLSSLSFDFFHIYLFYYYYLLL